MDDGPPIEGRKSGGKLRWIFASIALGYLALCLPWFDSRRSTCCACRLDRTDHRIVAFHRWTYRENECSRWYEAHVEASHTHAWVNYGRCRAIGLPGLTSGWACSFGPPITELPPSTQLRIYRRFRAPLEAKALFLKMESRDLERDDPMLTEDLQRWVHEETPETWDEWRAKPREPQGSP